MSAASYFKDEAGVHLSLHISGVHYIALLDSLLDSTVYESRELRELIISAHNREDRKASAPREIMGRFGGEAEDVLPSDGSVS